MPQSNPNEPTPATSGAAETPSGASGISHYATTVGVVLAMSTPSTWSWLFLAAGLVLLFMHGALPAGDAERLALWRRLLPRRRR
jgi:hypothetical protein